MTLPRGTSRDIYPRNWVVSLFRTSKRIYWWSLPTKSSSTLQPEILASKDSDARVMSGIVPLCLGRRKNDKPGPGSKVQDIFPPGVRRGHSPLDSPRVKISAYDNVPSSVEHTLFQTIDFATKVLNGLVGSEVATKKRHVPTLYPCKTAAASMTPHRRSRPKCSSTETVGKPRRCVPITILLAN
ncbi:hypothetical protein J6590_063197 [Homalodisca vitripennis]|nr:hypothetical protein J6590_063197 [Homalodisca vitripennis]